MNTSIETIGNDLTTLPHLQVTCVTGITESIAYLDELASGIVILYFYPKDATPGCTVQANDFTAYHADFKKLGATIIGISRDTVNAHKKFIEKQAIPFSLISDTEQMVCNYFDIIKPKNMYGKMVTGIVRSTFVYKNGTLLEAWRKVSSTGHAKFVLDYIASL